MSNGLSQAEIDALLSGDAVPSEEAAPDSAPEADLDLASDPAGDEVAESESMPEEGTPGSEPAPEPESASEPESEPESASEPESEPESAPEPEEPEPPVSSPPEPVEEIVFDPDILSSEEIDAIGEIGNISMGTAATTLFTLLGKRVDITTPKVKLTTMRQIAQECPLPFVAVQVAYTVGLVGNNILFLKEEDVKIITDLMMGGDGANTEGELSELHLSAISEVMNQMVGSSSTSLAKMIDTQIDIAPPHAYTVNLAEEINKPNFQQDEPVVKTSFTMEVEGLINSEIMQIMPVEFAKDLVTSMMNAQGASEQPLSPSTQEKAMPEPPQQQSSEPSRGNAPEPPPRAPAPRAKEEYDYDPELPRPRRHRQAEGRPVDVRPVQYDSFDEDELLAEEFGDNIQLLLDVPLQVTVELGKSKKFIKEILDFNIGTIIVLDKMAGELVDVVVNGKLIAKGEVVVIDDNYGARITDIVSPAKRINPTK